MLALVDDAGPLVAPGSRFSTQIVHDRLRARILSGDISAGAELSQSLVAKEFGVSRGPVREAFRLLQREGLIEAETNHRARITALSPQDVEHIYALRVVNEALALGVSIDRFSAADLEQMDELVQAVVESGGRDFATWEQQHQQFHALLLKHAGEGMRGSLALWAEHTERYRRVYVINEAGGFATGLTEHEQLARACRERDADTATRLLAQHLSRAALVLIATIDPAHDPALLRAAIRQVAGTGPGVGDSPERRSRPAKP